MTTNHTLAERGERREVTQADESLASVIMRHVNEHVDWCEWDLACCISSYRIAARNAALEEGLQSWDGLARAIMMGFDCDCRTPSKLFKHLIQSGHEIPDWMRKEQELQFADHVISKGTRCVLIYRAMTEHLRLSTQPHTNEGD